MNKVVSNATPIISLASVNKLSLLKDLFKKVYVPRAVVNEIITGKYPGHKELHEDYFEILDVKNKINLSFLLNDLDLGEAETIVAAKEIEADLLLIDERLGYKIAQLQGFTVIGTLTVLLKAKKKGLIKLVKPILDDMIQNGRWYSRSVYEHYLKTIGEL